MQIAVRWLKSPPIYIIVSNAGESHVISFKLNPYLCDLISIVDFVTVAIGYGSYESSSTYLRCAGASSGRKMSSAEDLRSQLLRGGASARCLTNVNCLNIFRLALKVFRTVSKAFKTPAPLLRLQCRPCILILQAFFTCKPCLRDILDII